MALIGVARRKEKGPPVGGPLQMRAPMGAPKKTLSDVLEEETVEECRQSLASEGTFLPL